MISTRIKRDEFGTTDAGKKRYLLLNFDGVLHPADVWFGPGQGLRLGPLFESHSLFEHARMLESLLAPHKDVLIVLSTSWVPAIGLPEAKARLPEGLARRVVGATFDPSIHGRSFGAVAHGYQVLEYVQRHNISNWIALDDEASNWPEQERERLIQTHAVHGLGDSVVQAKLLAWLGRV